MKGFRPGGRRKSGAERAEIGGNLPRGHPCHAFQRPKKPGKTGRYAEEIECEIGKLSDRENRRSFEIESRIVSRSPGCLILVLGELSVRAEAPFGAAFVIEENRRRTTNEQLRMARRGSRRKIQGAGSYRPC